MTGEGPLPLARDELASLQGCCRRIWQKIKDFPNERPVKDAVLEMVEILQEVGMR
jgi:hypothetical protein